MCMLVMVISTPAGEYKKSNGGRRVDGCHVHHVVCVILFPYTTETPNTHKSRIANRHPPSTNRKSQFANHNCQLPIAKIEMHNEIIQRAYRIAESMDDRGRWRGRGMGVGVEIGSHDLAKCQIICWTALSGNGNAHYELLAIASRSDNFS